MNYKVWHESDCKFIDVDEEWMEGVNLKNAKAFRYSSLTDKLEVIYTNDNSVYYKNVHGTWGFPVVFR